MMKSTVQKGLTNTIKEEMKMETMQRLENAIKLAKANNCPQLVIDAARKALRRLEAGNLELSDANTAIKMLEVELLPMNIESYDQLKPMLKTIKGKNSCSVVSIELSRDKYNRAEGTVTTVSQAEGRIMRGIKVEDTAIVKIGVNSSTVITKNSYAPFSKQMIAVKFKKQNDLKIAQDYGIFVIHAGKDTCSFMPIGNMFENIETGERVNELTSLVQELNGDLRHYKAFVFSPSDVRNVSYICVDVTNGDNREEVLDKITNGAWNKAKQHVSKMIADGKSAKEIELWILKIMPRFGQFKAGSTNLGLIPSWGELNCNFETKEGLTFDGSCVVSDVFIAERLSELSGMNISPKAVRGMFLQARPDTEKGAFNVVKETVIKRMWKVHRKNFDHRGDTSIAPVMLVDQNIIKADSNYRESDIFFELLEIATCSEANSSMQMMMKAIMADQKAAKEYMDKISTRYINEKVKSTFLREDATIPTPGMAAKKYVSDVVGCVAPKMILEDPSLHKSTMTNTLNSFVNAANKLKFSIDGNNVRLTSDLSQILVGEKDNKFNVINYGEVYMPAAYRYFLRKAKEEVLEETKGQVIDKKELKALIVERFNKMEKLVCMIKYPSMGIKEYYLAKVIGLSDVKARVAAMEIEDDAKEAIIDFYAPCKETLAVLPASALVMFQCAGLDYDFDGATFVYDEDFINIIKNQTLEATNKDS